MNQRVNTFLFAPTLAEVRQCIIFWKSDDAPGSIEMRTAVIAELEYIAARLCAQTN